MMGKLYALTSIKTGQRLTKWVSKAMAAILRDALLAHGIETLRMDREA